MLYWPKYWIFSTPSCRQSACHWSRPYRQSPTRIQESKSANCESAHRVASFWKGVSWAAVSSRSSSTLWPPRDTPLKSSSSLPPSLVEMWVAYLTLLQRKHPHVYKITNPLLLIHIQRKGFKRPTHRSCPQVERERLLNCRVVQSHFVPPFITVLCQHKQVLNSSLLQKSSSRLWSVLGRSSHLCWRDPQL